MNEATPYRRFAQVLRELVIERGFTTKVGNANWMEFSHHLPGVHYETLRKALTQERRPSPQLMEKCAEALNVDPNLFVEYRIWCAQRSVDPDIVGEESALQALEAWDQARLELGDG